VQTILSDGSSGSEPPVPPEPVFDDGSEATGIEQAFKRLLAGLRTLAPADRALALAQARQWRVLAHRELKEKRAARQAARRMLRAMNQPRPG